MKNFEAFKLETNQLDLIKGGITQAEFAASCKWLWDNGHYDQLAVVMKMANEGHINFSDL